MSILSSVTIVEFEGLGPGPFCGMVLADLGAEVITIERKGALSTGGSAIYRRGKRAVALNLKDPKAIVAARKIVAGADAIIEGNRPGVMERLGLGPDVLMADNPKLVYGRMTGWGQDGPLAYAAGHDLNYVSLSGAAWYAGQTDEHGHATPVPPPTLVGDIGGGALYLALGILSGVLNARETGKGAVVDAAIVDGSAHMMSLLMSLRAAGGMPDERGQSMVDGSPFYEVYRCADDLYISVAPLEPKFYADLVERLGLSQAMPPAEQFDTAKWPAGKAQLAAVFAAKPRAEWIELLEGTDVCFAPVLSPGEAAIHPHMKAREVYREIGGVLQAAPAPRFNGDVPADPTPPPAPGADSEAILAAAGLSSEEVTELLA